MSMSNLKWKLTKWLREQVADQHGEYCPRANRPPESQAICDCGKKGRDEAFLSVINFLRDV